MTFRKLKLIDNRPSRPALNFRGKCRNTMLFSPKTRVMSAIAELTPKKKTVRGRKSLSPSVRDNFRLCGCSFKVKFGSQARHIGTENLFQPSKQKGSFGVILAKLCESVGLPVKYCEDKSDRVCSSCGRKIRNLHQLFSFVSSALINSDNEDIDSSEERFKRCLPTSVSSPDRSPPSRKIQKQVHGRVADQEIVVDRREEQEEGEEETRVNRKRAKSRKTLFSISGRDKENVDLSDDDLSLLTVDEFSNVKETKIKVLISYPSGHVEVRSAEGKKTLSLVKNIALKQWEAVCDCDFRCRRIQGRVTGGLEATRFHRV